MLSSTWGSNWLHLFFFGGRHRLKKNTKLRSEIPCFCFSQRLHQLMANRGNNPSSILISREMERKGKMTAAAHLPSLSLFLFVRKLNFFHLFSIFSTSFQLNLGLTASVSLSCSLKSKMSGNGNSNSERHVTTISVTRCCEISSFGRIRFFLAKNCSFFSVSQKFWATWAHLNARGQI